MSLTHEDVRQRIAFWPMYLRCIPEDLRDLYGSPEIINRFLDSAIEISTYLSRPISEIIPLIQSDVLVQHDWRSISPSPGDEDSLLDFYSRTDSFIYDGMYNYARPGSEEGFLWLLDRVRTCSSEV